MFKKGDEKHWKYLSFQKRKKIVDNDFDKVISLVDIIFEKKAFNSYVQISILVHLPSQLDDEVSK